MQAKRKRKLLRNILYRRMQVCNTSTTQAQRKRVTQVRNTANVQRRLVQTLRKRNTVTVSLLFISTQLSL